MNILMNLTDLCHNWKPYLPNINKFSWTDLYDMICTCTNNWMVKLLQARNQWIESLTLHGDQKHWVSNPNYEIQIDLMKIVCEIWFLVA